MIPQEAYISIFPEQATVVYGNFWQRTAAYIIDNLILFPAQIIVSNSYSGQSAIGNLLLGKEANQLGWESDVILFVLYMAYFIIMELSGKQATLGKMALKLKVTNKHGGRISAGQATGRYLLKYLCIPTLLVSHLMIFWDKKHQALHDRLMHTFVVRKQQPDATQLP